MTADPSLMTVSQHDGYPQFRHYPWHGCCLKHTHYVWHGHCLSWVLGYAVLCVQCERVIDKGL